MNDIRLGGRIKSPCKGCDRRTAECHAKCEDYLQFFEDHAKERQLIHKRRDKAKKRTVYRTEKQWKTALQCGKKTKVFRDHKK